MLTGRGLAAPAAFAAAVLAATAAVAVLAGTATAASTTLCASQTTNVAGGAYIVQNNEWGSSASECVTTDGNADFTVANSAISNSTSGAPGGYPSVYRGCHWGVCTANSGLPIQVGALTTSGTVTTSWNTTQTGNGAYDAAFDIWFNQTPTTSGQPNAEEMMIWLNHNGPVQPSGGVVASGVSIGGHTYNVWEAQDSTWKDVSYVMTSGTSAVSGLDIGLLAADSLARGYMTSSDYLIDVEAGFELWQGGAGLAANSYAVDVNGSGGTTPPTTTPPTTAPPTTTPPTTQPTASAGCTAAYSVTSSWQGGFQGQVTVTNTGSAPTSGWSLAWTFPGDQKISNLWNGSYTQTGQQVGVTNAAYNGAIPASGTTTVGFTATGSAGTPPSVTCTTP